MSEFQMPSAENKAEFVQTNFNIIAGKYDLFNDLNSFYLHRYWKNQIIQFINKNFSNKEIKCMDLCCGTGDISVRLNKIHEIKEVHSVDFSENMLSVARKRLESFSNSKVSQGDATNLNNFQSNSLDVITIGFGLRNVNDLEKAISEIHRVLKPGGVFINLDVGKVKNKFIKFFADFYFFKIVPLIGYIIWGGKNKMFDYLPVSSLHYPDQDKLKSILENSGFTNVEYKNFVFGNAVMHTAFKK
ncbi:MAG: ubiquinone/menaquinone biosynthesis methyltransferase [Leptospiraceae bacterium]|nr:ubiquinone/menaquinone biosynthesis methyltransferase [Leptospiraceae bacterium]